MRCAFINWITKNYILGITFLIIIIVFSYILFIKASNDARLEFLGEIIGIPASICITIFSDNYIRQKHYIDSQEDNLYEINNILRIIRVLMARSHSNCIDILNSKNSKFYDLMTKLTLNMNQVPDSTINKLSANAQEFYKKREIKIRHHKFNSKVRKRIKNNNAKGNIKLNKVYMRLALVQSGFNKIESNKNSYNFIFLRNATQQASRTAKCAERFFKQLEKDM